MARAWGGVCIHLLFFEVRSGYSGGGPEPAEMDKNIKLLGLLICIVDIEAAVPMYSAQTKCNAQRKRGGYGGGTHASSLHFRQRTAPRRH